MPLLTLNGVACAAPDGSPLFSGLTVSLNRERLGLVGRNGCGKTTLLNAIAGAVPLAAGRISLTGKIGVLRQLPPASHATIGDALGVTEALACLDRIAGGLAEESDLVEADWSLPARLEAIAAATGLASFDPGRVLSSLSGGERRRVMLAALLLPEPDILLLDEPTNNLDAPGRTAVAELLAGWQGGAIVASHDRTLLGEMDRIVELTRTGIHIVGGGWALFDSQRRAEREHAEEALHRSESALKQAQRERQHEAEKQARRDKQGRKAAARDDQPRIALHRQQQRAEATAAHYRRLGDALVEQASDNRAAARGQVEILTPIRIALPLCGLPAGHVLVSATGLVCERGGKPLFGPLDLVVRGPQRIALAGGNGSGKTSLIRLILGLDAPAAGQIRADRERIALLDQHLALLDGAATLNDAMTRHNPALDRQAAHAALAAYGFRSSLSERAVASLSGGERVRLALACLFSRPEPPQMLVLDEPTNHLDLAATEMLESALRDYDGAILCVSHDEAFRAALAPSETIRLGA